MDTLDFNLHQLVLSDLAATVAKPGHAQSEAVAVNAIASRVQTRDLSGPDIDPHERASLSVSAVECNIAFGELAMNTHGERVPETISVLVELIRDIPYIDFPESLMWQEWALPDQLSYSTVSALLRLASAHPEHRKTCIESVISFCNTIVSQLKTAPVPIVIAETSPEFHGLYRAIMSTPLAWTFSEWEALTRLTNDIFAPEVVDRLNGLLASHVNADQSETAEAEEESIIKTEWLRTILRRYAASNRPLSGYFAVCGVMEIQWTILAQVLVPPLPVQPLASTSTGITHSHSTTYGAAEASNSVWASLMSKSLSTKLRMENVDESMLEAAKKALENAAQCFEDLLAQIEEFGDVEEEMYAFETLSSSLKLATVCSLALQDLDPALLERVKAILSDRSPVVDSFLQDAALKSVTVLVQNFKSVAQPLAYHLRRFVTSPIPTFQYDETADFRPSPSLIAAARALALCIKMAPDSDLGLSYMYSVFNYIPVGSDGQQGSQLLTADGSLGETQRGLQIYPERDRQLIAVNAVSVVTRLALDLEDDEITKLATSMLLQRLLRSEPDLESAIAFNLVDLALASDVELLNDIIKTYSRLSLASVATNAAGTAEGEGSDRHHTIVAAQTRLAHEMSSGPEHLQSYLTELLALFSDLGTGIQVNASTKGHYQPHKDNLVHLSDLIIPIQSLLTNPHLTTPATDSLANLFQDFWLVVAVFRLCDPNLPFMNSWKYAGLTKIAAHTPVFVSEEVHDYLSSNIEYNRVLRKDYVEHNLQNYKSALSKNLGGVRSAGNVKQLSGPQCVFVLAIYDLESLRAISSLPSALPSHFVNASINENIYTLGCMDAVAEAITRQYKTIMASKIVDHSLTAQMTTELRSLLVSACHRVEKPREVAFKLLDSILTGFPSLLCESSLVFALLDTLTLLQSSCDGGSLDEYNPHYTFHSERGHITLSLTDSYATRRSILTTMHTSTKRWIDLAVSRAPYQVQAVLQNYLTNHGRIPVPFSTELGASVALQCASQFNASQKGRVAKSPLDSWAPDRAQLFANEISAHAYFAGEGAGVRLAGRISQGDIQKSAPLIAPIAEVDLLKQRLSAVLVEIQKKSTKMNAHDLRRILFRCASVLLTMSTVDHELLHYLVAVPFESMTPATITTGLETWTWLLQERPDVEIPLMLEINSAWLSIIQQKKGMFSPSLNATDPFNHPIAYAPTGQGEIDRSMQAARRLLLPHVILMQGISSIFQAVRYRRAPLMRVLTRLVVRSAMAHETLSTHPLAREARFTLLLIGFQTLRNSRLSWSSEKHLRDALYDAAFAWFAVRPQWTFGANRVQLEVDVKMLQDFLGALKDDHIRGEADISSLGSRGASKSHEMERRDKSALLKMLVENEMSRLLVWANPVHEPSYPQDRPAWDSMVTADGWTKLVQTAWKINPAIAVHMVERIKLGVVVAEVTRLVRLNPSAVIDVPEALRLLAGDGGGLNKKILHSASRQILLWKAVPPVLAVTYFEPRWLSDPSILQYAHRVLEGHPVELTFFFVPQVVQALRTDTLGYVERFIFETAKISQLFCHQIIWNMKANTHRDDAGEEEDPMKPMFDRMIDMVVASLSGPGKEFYDREFDFFGEVTAISGKLKPYRGKTKAEKKAKIDEEMAKIKVDVGVYLPSNPDGVVVDIDKRSGRPLQSHAKAPFMATFKVRKERVVVEDRPDSVLEEEYEVEGSQPLTHFEVWQAAIFKVGDDCRQDVLAIQLIAMFKNVFERVGLPLYLYPYRVIATGPGMGVIDVVPNATSRDEMGRAKVNDLMGFFTAKYGHQESVAFQKARLNFIQSMAAYSVACYILQIKDRHNGNIMIDGEGHIVHIDFGFLFDIDEFFVLFSTLWTSAYLPSAALWISTSRSEFLLGVKFEPSSFKLNHEMVVLMGGRYSEGYQLFQRLTVKAFLAIRPHVDQLVETTRLMLGTSLPSFKGEGTIQRLRDRFAPNLGERQAADFMVAIVKNAHENVRSTVYDEFQRLQNGIPYA